MNFLSRNAFRFLQVVSLLLLVQSVKAQSSSTQDPALEARPYFSLQVMSVGSVHATGPEIALGGPVVIQGTSSFGRSNAFGFLIGREFRKETNEEKNTMSSEPEDARHTRLELEYWTGSVKQTALDVGRVSLVLNDKVSAQALTMNGLFRLAKTENSRWWVGAGLGWGSVSQPNRLGSIPGCQCFAEAKSSGSTWRVKLVGERQINEDTAAYLQLGHLQLPGVSNSGTPSIKFGKLGLNDLGIGLRFRF